MSNQQNKFMKRTARPQTIAGAVGGLLRIFGGRASDADFANRWNEIMGKEIAEIASLAAIKKMPNNKYNIVIRPKTAAFALPLSYRQTEIKNRINKYFGQDSVGKITFRR